MEAEQKIEVLKKVDLFRETSQKVLEGISGVLEDVSYDEGHSIICKGDLDKELFILIEGKVKVHDGDLTIAHLDGLKVFGEYSLLDTEPRSVSITSTEPVVLWKLKQRDFYNTLESNPGVAQSIIATLVTRLRERTKQIITESKSREEELQKQVKEKTIDLTNKNLKLQNTLKILEETRGQLVAKEKMASLGQLTAGIAHEIKNPLNFINNLSMISSELVDDIYEDILDSNKPIDGENLIELKEILESIQVNSKKVAGHGKRADEIVQGMLLHSRRQSVEMEKVIINRLLKEAVKLSFHGWKSRDSSFNSELILNIPDEDIQINALPSEISRVFLNIVDNALYELSKFYKGSDTKGKIEASLFDEGDNVRVVIKDNGPGIPKDVADKLFEPFYTTKPAGKGTGLGLSICFDIIVKAHKGSLSIDSKQQEGAAFIIVLPKK